MSIPIISEVLDLVEKGIDKVWPDANTKEETKVKIKAAVLEQAMQEKKLLFQDTEGARKVFIEELRAQNTPKWARAVQVCGRQFALYSTVTLYIYSKVSVQLNLPPITLNERDYWLIGTVFIFLFGARSVEKVLGKA